MGYARTEAWGRPIEFNGGFAGGLSVTTVEQDIAMGQGQFPTWADLDNGQVIGAYCDLQIPWFNNLFAGTNYIVSATYAKLCCNAIGHGVFDCISNLNNMMVSNAALNQYPYVRIFGDENFSSLFQPGSHYFGHNCEWSLYNIAALQNSIYLGGMNFIFRFYVR
jgi:hypothetical protein